MFEKLIELLLTLKGAAAAGAVTIAVVVTGTVGADQLVDELTQPLATPTPVESVLVTDLETEEVDEVEEVAGNGDGQGCGEIVGTARGAAIQALQSAWHGYHSEVMGLMDQLGGAERDARAAMRAAVHEGREELTELRNAALSDLHAKADEFKDSCGSLTLASAEDEYQAIVDAAIETMAEVVEAAKAAFAETSSTSTATEGKPENAGGPPANLPVPPGRGR
jgi:hypothetical protein